MDQTTEWVKGSHAVVEGLFVQIEACYDEWNEVYYDKVLAKSFTYLLSMLDAFISYSCCWISQITHENFAVGSFVTIFTKFDRKFSDKFNSSQTNAPLYILRQIKQDAFKLFCIDFGSTHVSNCHIITGAVEPNIWIVVLDKLINNWNNSLKSIIFTNIFRHLAKSKCYASFKDIIWVCISPLNSWNDEVVNLFRI